MKNSFNLKENKTNKYTNKDMNPKKKNNQRKTKESCMFKVL